MIKDTLHAKDYDKFYVKKKSTQKKNHKIWSWNKKKMFKLWHCVIKSNAEGKKKSHESDMNVPKHDLRLALTEIVSECLSGRYADKRTGQVAW